MSKLTLDTDNKEWQQALQIVQYTRRSLFLTGKAGTGKSTFLRYVAESTKKKYVILAPTGIAAINAGGQTLHSFFKLPFHPLLPNDSRYNIRNIRKTLKYSGDTIKLLRELELIIIDEISMVRSTSSILSTRCCVSTAVTCGNPSEGNNYCWWVISSS